MDKPIFGSRLNRSWFTLCLLSSLAVVVIFIATFFLRYQIAKESIIQDFSFSAEKLQSRMSHVDRLLEQRLFLLENSAAMQRVVNDPSELATVGLLSEWTKFSKNFDFSNRLYYIDISGELLLRLDHNNDQPVITWGNDRISVLSHYFSTIKWAVPGKVYQHKIGLGAKTRFLLYLPVFDKWANLHGFIVQEYTQADLNSLVYGLGDELIDPYLVVLQFRDWNSVGSRGQDTIKRVALGMGLGEQVKLNYETVMEWYKFKEKGGYELETEKFGLLLKQQLPGFINNKPILLLLYISPANIVSAFSSWIVFWTIALLLSLIAAGVISYLWANRQQQSYQVAKEQALRLAMSKGEFSQLIVDSIGKVTAVNGFHCKLVGMRKEDIIGLNADAFMMNMEPNLASIMEMAREYSGWKGEVKWFDAKGEVHFMRATLSILLNEMNQIEQCVFSGSDFSAQKALEERLQELADTDPLTGCFNRRAFDQAIAREYSRASRSQQKFCLIMLDIDYFANINDTNGHDIGDRVLVELVNEVNSHIRAADIFARWAADQFVLLLPETRDDQAVLLAERLRKAVANRTEHPAYTISIGVVEGDCTINSDELFNRIEKALQQAKSYGRNRVVCSTPELVHSQIENAE